MTSRMRRTAQTLPTVLIAPCGMNCRLCWGFTRKQNSCPGCLVDDRDETKKSKSRHTCTIRNCDQLASFDSVRCSSRCERFPCKRMRQLDKRYRSRYGMSMIANLQMIEESGIRDFIRGEKLKWNCPACGALICVHKRQCIECGHERCSVEDSL